MTVANCSKCQRVFQRNMIPLCPACHQESQEQVSNVYRFVQEHPRLTLDDIATQCGLPLRDLEEIFFSGKLGTATRHVIYHCQRCDRPIAANMRHGRFCAGCAEKVEVEAGLHLHLAPTEKAPARPGPKKADAPHSTPEEAPMPAVPVPTANDGFRPEVLKTEEPAGESYGFKRVKD